MKTCAACRVQKSLGEFVRNRDRRDGIHNYCKSCVAAKEREKCKDPEYRERKKERRREWGRRNRAKTARWAQRRCLRVKYNLTTEQYDAMVAAQAGRCAICDLMPDELVVDHDHASGDVRALLCRTCNSGIGHLRDDTDLIRRALSYLERFSAKQTMRIA